MAPKTDGYRTKLGYCSWDNGNQVTSVGRIAGTNSLSKPVIAVLSSGLDGQYQTTCADLAGTAVTKGDDFAVVFNSAQIRQGIGGTIYWGDPVGDIEALGALSPAGAKDGEIRLVGSDNSLWRWSSSSGEWRNVSAPFLQSGVDNIGIFESGRPGANGTRTTAVGVLSLRDQIDSVGDTAVGWGAAGNLRSGGYNAGLGIYTLGGLREGTNNTAIGAYAGFAGVSGGAAYSNSVFVGYNAAPAAEIATANSGAITLVGANTKASGLSFATSSAYMTALGAGATVSSINTVVLGRPDDSVVIGQATAHPSYKLFVAGTSGGTSAFANASDARYKTNVSGVNNALGKILAMEGVYYEFDRVKYGHKNFEAGRQIGFIAQQIEGILPEVVRTDAEGYKMVQYSQVVPLLVEGIKEQQGLLKHLHLRDPSVLTVDIKTFQANDVIARRIEAHEAKVAALEAEKARVGKLTAGSIEAGSIRGNVINSGSKTTDGGNGDFRSLFSASDDGQYIVTIMGEGGSSAYATVAVIRGKVVVSIVRANGISILSNGTAVGFTTFDKQVNAVWMRVS
jgi:hypothetical protein